MEVLITVMLCHCRRVHTAFLLALARILAWTLKKWYVDYLLAPIPSLYKISPFDPCPKTHHGVAGTCHVIAALPARVCDMKIQQPNMFYSGGIFRNKSLFGEKLSMTLTKIFFCSLYASITTKAETQFGAGANGQSQAPSSYLFFPALSKQQTVTQRKMFSPKAFQMPIYAFMSPLCT